MDRWMGEWMSGYTWMKDFGWQIGLWLNGRPNGRVYRLMNEFEWKYNGWMDE